MHHPDQFQLPFCSVLQPRFSYSCPLKGLHNYSTPMHHPDQFQLLFCSVLQPRFSYSCPLKGLHNYCTPMHHPDQFQLLFCSVLQPRFSYTSKLASIIFMSFMLRGFKGIPQSQHGIIPCTNVSGLYVAISWIIPLIFS